MKIIRNLLMFGLGFGCAIAWKAGYLDSVTKMGSELISKIVNKNSSAESNTGNTETSLEESNSNGTNSSDTSSSNSNTDVTYDYTLIRVVVEPYWADDTFSINKQRYYSEDSIKGTYKMTMSDLKNYTIDYRECPTEDSQYYNYVDLGYTFEGYGLDGNYYSLTNIPDQSVITDHSKATTFYHVYVTNKNLEWYNNLA